jgi:Cdc6-like AAA superfamily ATPase
MDILIQHNNLIDFPFDPERKEYHSIFDFDLTKVNNLVSEILYTEPTCYLVSGYRGSGKTSFIRKVQFDSRFKNNNESEKKLKDILFIYSSFSRFENKTYFLRKIIRDLQEAVSMEAKTKSDSGNKDLLDLYDKTFLEIKREESEQKESALENKISLDSDHFFTKLFKGLAPLLIPLSELILRPFYLTLNWAPIPFLKEFLYVGSIIWAAVNSIKFSSTYSLKNTKTRKVSKISLSDDNITEYDLEKVLNNFTENGYKLVFVLDELDKVDDEELDKLLKEMKPWLVRGKADFILVAGQKLTMKYYNFRERDDEILTSLFSKIIHISPLTEQQLRKIFKDFLFMGLAEDGKPIEKKAMQEFEESKIMAANGLCDALIYRSKRLPRTFMNLVRQDLQWKNGNAMLSILQAVGNSDEIKTNVLKKMFENISLRADIAETVKGHLIMQLYRGASFITDKNRSVIQCQELIELICNPDKLNEFEYPYREIYPVLKETIEEFYQEAIKQGLILKVTPTNTATPSSGTLSGIAEIQLVEFKIDFLALISLLSELQNELLQDSRPMNPNETVGTLLMRYKGKGIIDPPTLESAPFQQTIQFYSSRTSDNSVFENVYTLFDSQHILLQTLFLQLFEYFTTFKLREVFQSALTLSRKDFATSTVFENQVSDYKVTLNESEALYSYLFNYKFINGSVLIDNEEINKSINILDDYNLQMMSGNYYISIIFFKTNTAIDSDKISMNTQLQIESLRPDLKGKILYWLISVFEFQKLKTLIFQLQQNAGAYSNVPVVSKSKTFIKKQRPVPKRTISDTQSSKATILDPDDPQRGMWGGKPKTKDRELTAKVFSDNKSFDWFNVQLQVKSLNPTNPLTGKVTFYLHDSFIPDKYTVLAKNGVAEIKDLYCYEAFTVGVSCDNNTTKLELDLNKLKDAPKEFKY